MTKEKILIVEDDKDINELVEYNLTAAGYKSFQAFDGEEALEIVKKESPALIILDIMIPEIDGLEVCKIIKQDVRTRNIPVVMLTAKGEESDIIVGLKLGADDYVVKPFSPKVLVERVKTVLRRMQEKQKPSDVRTVGDLVVDTVKHRVSYKGKTIELTLIEFKILEFLSRQPGRVFSRDQIMDGAWNEGKFIVDRAVDVHVRGLRKKLGKAAEFIQTVRGIGYRFKEIEP